LLRALRHIVEVERGASVRGDQRDERERRRCKDAARATLREARARSPVQKQNRPPKWCPKPPAQKAGPQ
jgi:hypothetical protein